MVLSCPLPYTHLTSTLFQDFNERQSGTAAMMLDKSKTSAIELGEVNLAERAPFEGAKDQDDSLIKSGTAVDRSNMRRLGRKQQLSRNFHS